MQVNLARRMMQRWATRVACLVDFNDELPRDELDLTEVLRALGKVRLREGQLPVILAVLKGNDVLAVRPTGSGKSLCFQVPTMLRAGTSLVLEPLKALMKDQVRSLQSLQIPATFISGDLSPKERLARFDLLEQGTWKFVYMAPERFDSSMVRDPSEQARLDRFRPSHLVVDEAHSIAQYGNGFRPFYARCGEIRERLGRPQVVAFTATANPAMQQEICRSLGSPGATIIVESPNRPNIALARVPMGRKDPERFRIMARVLAQVTVGRAMIFVPTVREGEIVQSGLRSHGLDLEFFHSNAGTANWRDNLQGRFDGRIEPRISAIIATSAFGMGLDIPDVRVAIHWQHPFSVEEYLQGFGRAGRDGRPSLALLFVDRAADEGLLRWMLGREVPSPARERDLQTMVRAANATDRCFRHELNLALGGDRPTRRSWSVRILEWAFGDRARVEPVTTCCDRCSPELDHGVRHGQVDLLVAG
jgi:ATP-dependent DNA helicase RecQ